MIFLHTHKKQSERGLPLGAETLCRGFRVTRRFYWLRWLPGLSALKRLHHHRVSIAYIYVFEHTSSMPTLKIQLLPQESEDCKGPVSVPTEFQERMPILLENHVKPDDWVFLCSKLNIEFIPLYESQKALHVRKMMFKMFALASIIISSIGISILATNLKVKVPFLILYMVLLWLLVTLLLLVPIIVPIYKLKQNYQRNKNRIDCVCRRQSRRHRTVKFKVIYEEDEIFLKLIISTADDNLESEVADSQPSSEISLKEDQYLDLEVDKMVEMCKIEHEDIEEARSLAHTLEITEASKSVNYTPISPKDKKALNISDDSDSNSIKA